MGGGGTPIPGLDRAGVSPSQVWMGVPHPRPDGGGGVTLLSRSGPRTGWGVPPSRNGLGTPHQETEQHSDDFLRGGPYVSCVHAGGLSCLCL